MSASGGAWALGDEVTEHDAVVEWAGRPARAPRVPGVVSEGDGALAVPQAPRVEVGSEIDVGEVLDESEEVRCPDVVHGRRDSVAGPAR